MECAPRSLCASSAERIVLNFGFQESLRTFPKPIFTGGVVKENGICSAAFCESAALRLASSPSQALTRQIPLFVAARHLPPARGKSFLKGRALGMAVQFPAKVQSIRSRQSLSLWERWHGVSRDGEGEPV